MQASLNKQHGLSFLSLTFYLVLFGFFVLLGFKIGPLYLNNSKVVSSVEALKNTSDIVSKTKAEIRDSLMKRFGINYVDHVTNDDITIYAQPGYVKVDIEYERVEPLFGNLSILAKFHEGFETGSK